VKWFKVTIWVRCLRLREGTKEQWRHGLFQHPSQLGSCKCAWCDAVCCSVFRVLQCVVVCCSVLQCVAVCCSMLRCVAAFAVALAAPAKDGHAWHTTARAVFATQERGKKNEHRAWRASNRNKEIEPHLSLIFVKHPQTFSHQLIAWLGHLRMRGHQKL